MPENQQETPEEMVHNLMWKTAKKQHAEIQELNTLIELSKALNTQLKLTCEKLKNEKEPK